MPLVDADDMGTCVTGVRCKLNHACQREVIMSSISGISSNLSQYQVNGQNSFKQWQQDFDDLGSALQSGDLSKAQTAYSALVQNTPSNSQAQNSQQSGTSSIGADFTALGQALQSGNVSDAQTAYAKVQQDLQSAHGHHHHHRGGQASGAQSTSADAIAALLTTNNGTGENTSSASNSGNVNITA